MQRMGTAMVTCRKTELGPRMASAQRGWVDRSSARGKNSMAGGLGVAQKASDNPERECRR